MLESTNFLIARFWPSNNTCFLIPLLRCWSSATYCLRALADRLALRSRDHASAAALQLYLAGFRVLRPSRADLHSSLDRWRTRAFLSSRSDRRRSVSHTVMPSQSSPALPRPYRVLQQARLRSWRSSPHHRFTDSTSSSFTSLLQRPGLLELRQIIVLLRCRVVLPTPYLVVSCRRS